MKTKLIIISFLILFSSKLTKAQDIGVLSTFTQGNSFLVPYDPINNENVVTLNPIARYEYILANINSFEQSVINEPGINLQFFSAYPNAIIKSKKLSGYKLGINDSSCFFYDDIDLKVYEKDLINLDNPPLVLGNLPGLPKNHTYLFHNDSSLWTESEGMVKWYSRKEEGQQLPINCEEDPFDYAIIGHQLFIIRNSVDSVHIYALNNRGKVAHHKQYAGGLVGDYVINTGQDHFLFCLNTGKETHLLRIDRKGKIIDDIITNIIPSAIVNSHNEYGSAFLGSLGTDDYAIWFYKGGGKKPLRVHDFVYNKALTVGICQLIGRNLYFFDIIDYDLHLYTYNIDNKEKQLLKTWPNPLRLGDGQTFAPHCCVNTGKELYFSLCYKENGKWLSSLWKIDKQEKLIKVYADQTYVKWTFSPQKLIIGAQNKYSDSLQKIDFTAKNIGYLPLSGYSNTNLLKSLPQYQQLENIQPYRNGYLMHLYDELYFLTPAGVFKYDLPSSQYDFINNSVLDKTYYFNTLSKNNYAQVNTFSPESGFSTGPELGGTLTYLNDTFAGQVFYHDHMIGHYDPLTKKKHSYLRRLNGKIMSGFQVNQYTPKPIGFMNKLVYCLNFDKQQRLFIANRELLLDSFFSLPTILNITEFNDSVFVVGLNANLDLMYYMCDPYTKKSRLIRTSSMGAGYPQVKFLGITNNRLIMMIRRDNLKYELVGLDKNFKDFKDIFPGYQFNAFKEIAHTDSFMLIGYSESTDSTTYWVTNGTRSGTHKLVNHAKANRVDNDKHRPRPTAMNNKIYFNSWTDEFGFEIWETRGKPENTRMVKDLWTSNNSASSAYPIILGSRNDSLFFAANVPHYGTALMYLTEANKSAPSDLTVNSVGTEDAKLSWKGKAQGHLLLCSNKAFNDPINFENIKATYHPNFQKSPRIDGYSICYLGNRKWQDIYGLDEGTKYYLRLYSFKYQNNKTIDINETNFLDTTIFTKSSFPNNTPTALTFSNVRDSSFVINWKNKKFSTLILVCNTEQNSFHHFNPGDEPFADSLFGAGEQILDTCFVVYGGMANSVSVSGLRPKKRYYAQAYSYNRNLNDSTQFSPYAAQIDTVTGLILPPNDSFFIWWYDYENSVLCAESGTRRHVSLFNLQGQLVETFYFEQGRNRIRLSHLHSGMFILRTYEFPARILRFVKPD